MTRVSRTRQNGKEKKKSTWKRLGSITRSRKPWEVKSGRYVITVKDIQGLAGLSQWHRANFNSDPGNSGAEEEFFLLY